MFPTPAGPPSEVPSLSRRRLLKMAVAAMWSFAALPPSYSVGGTFDTYALDIHDVTVPVPGLPRHLEGFTIAHITDTHLREIGQLEERVIAAVQAREPAVVALTGDMVSSHKALPILAEFCHALTAPGRLVLATRGNHEVWAQVPVATLSQLYQRAGARLLKNEYYVVDASLTIVGTDDSVTKRYNLPAALRGMPSTPIRIHFSHAPGVFDRTPGPAVSFALCLAGHTHGGQIRLPFLPPYVPPGSGRRFVAGWYADTQLGPAYVSRGVGTTAIPLRLNCPPELPFLRLTRA